MELPLDILISILEHLPASHAANGEESILVFIAFLEASSLLREAAKISTLWQPHYSARYHHCNDYEDSQRRSETKGDWRLLYAARRRIDRKALSLLDRIVQQRNGQLDHVAALCSMSFDVWDVLEIEASQPVPPLLRAFYNDPSDASSVAPHAITRRYWARTILESIARIYAVNLWDRQQRGDLSVTFVDSFSALSCFSGFSPKYVRVINHLRGVPYEFPDIPSFREPYFSLPGTFNAEELRFVAQQIGLQCRGLVHANLPLHGS